MLRTIEAVLGLAPMGLNDALAAPMADVFDPAQADWSFTAQVPAVLRTTQLPLPPPTAAEAGLPGRAAALARPTGPRPWPARTSPARTGSTPPRYNRALWRGLKGDAPYPARRDGRDLREGRAALLAAAGVAGAGDRQIAPAPSQLAYPDRLAAAGSSRLVLVACRARSGGARGRGRCRSPAW